MCNKYFVRKQFVASKFSVIYSLLYFITGLTVFPLLSYNS